MTEYVRFQGDDMIDNPLRNIYPIPEVFKRRIEWWRLEDIRHKEVIVSRGGIWKKVPKKFITQWMIA